MHEILYIAPVMRLPIVMAVANRALSGPINIWNDHSDIMSERDCGWIQIFAENAQEACDLTIWAFRVAEDQRVSLPTIVNFDGFVLSHMTEALLMPEQETVSKFLPPFKPVQRLDVDNPISMGVVGTVDIYTEAKKQQQETLRQSYATVVNALAEFGNVFGRHYKPVETYRTDDADALLLVMGSIAETAMTAVDRARAKGKKVGLVHPRLWRPFPDQDLLRAIGNAKTLGVVDRAITYGGLGGPVACEVKSALYQQPHRPTVLEFVAGLGGRDVGFDDFEQMFDQMLQTRTNHVAPAMQLVGARE